MIGRLTGRLVAKHPPQVVVDIGGVAYEVDVPMSTFYSLPATGELVSLHTHLVVREDAHLLYGFATLDERTAFRRLIRISGIGARTALSVLSGLSVGDLADAVGRQEAGRLVKIPGIGKKTAERLVMELRDRIGEVRGVQETGGREPTGKTREAVLALTALGATQGSAEKAVAEVVDEEGDLPVEQIIKRALRKVI